MTRSTPFQRAVRCLLLACCVLGCCQVLSIAAFGQTATATLSGTVEDENGALIPNAAVTAINAGTALQRDTTTDEKGRYVLPLLPPGTYIVRVQAQGFATVENSNVVLNVGDQKSLQVHLKAGNITEMVQITGEAALINESPAVATTIDRTLVANLPLNGRSFASLVLLTPGVTVATSSTNTDAGQFSVNGQRPSTNYFTVDGAGANFGTVTAGGGAKNGFLSGAYPATSITGGTSNLVSIDALEQFTIQTSSYTAESGRQPGGQVQIVTRSGKNEFHGLLFEYFRNEALDARQYFNRVPAPQSPLRQNNYGGTFSGPLPFFNVGEGGPVFTTGKDRTFFFFSYEAQRLKIPRSGIVDVPSIRLRSQAHSSLQPILNAFPIPTGPEIVTALPCPVPPAPPNPRCDPVTNRLFSGRAPFNFSTADITNLDSTGIRIDHTVNKSLTLFGRFNEAPSDTMAGVVPIFQSFANTRTLTLGATSVLSTSITNDLRFNYSRHQAKSGALMPTLGGAVPISDTSVFTTGLPGVGSVSILSAGQISAGTFTDSYQRQINFVDNMSVIKGAHNLKFGFDFRSLSPIFGAMDSQSVNFGFEASSDGIFGTRSGVFEFIAFQTAQPAEPQFSNFSAYVQDSWKASHRLTLDFGVRWEVNPAPTEKEGRMPPIVLGVVGTDVSGATLAPPGTEFYKTFWTAFAPRFGAAYQLRTQPGRETIIRGGVGVYYDLGGGTAATGWPILAQRFVEQPTLECPMMFPLSPTCAVRPGIVPVTPANTSLFNFRTPNQDIKLPYSFHWNFALEQSLGQEQALSVSYVGSAGRQLLATLNLNLQRRDPVTGASLPRPNPNFRTISYSFNGPRSDYHSLQAQYKARLKRGLQALVNYTWSHAIDEVSSDNQFFAIVLERGNANFDVRHNVSAALNYDLPRLDAGPFLSWLFRDWTISAIVHAESGRPLNVSVLGDFVDPDGTSFSTRPDLVTGVPVYITDPSVPGGRRFNVAAFQRPPGVPGFPNVAARQGNFGRNVLRELPLSQVDFSLARSFRLTEKVALKLTGDAFNAFNHPMFSGYNTSYSPTSTTFGVPTTTLSSGLGGLSALYQLGGPRSIQLSARLSF